MNKILKQIVELEKEQDNLERGLNRVIKTEPFTEEDNKKWIEYKTKQIKVMEELGELRKKYEEDINISTTEETK